MDVGTFEYLGGNDSMMYLSGTTIIPMDVDQNKMFIYFVKHLYFFFTEWMMKFNHHLKDLVKMFVMKAIDPLNFSSFNIHFYKYIFLSF